MTINPNHITFEAEKDVRQILKPLLKRSDICYFAYAINYPDGSYFTLLSHTDYYLEFVKKEFPFLGHAMNTGWHTWSSFYNKEQIELSQSMNLGNGIFHINHHIDKTEIFEFATKPENSKIIDFYVNNLPLLKHFSSYFIDSAKNIIDEANHQLLRLPNNMMLNSKMTPIKLHIGSMEEVREILEEFKSPIARLSDREFECFVSLILGCSIKKICQQLNSRSSTVSNYIFRLKQKLKVSNREDMVQLAKQCSLFDYLALIKE